MKLEDVINEKWLNSKNLNKEYKENQPFPHIVLNDFIKPSLLKKIVNEFPDLENKKEGVNKFNDKFQIKFGSEGSLHLSKNAIFLNAYLQSDIMLKWLNDLTGIHEPLISDPYLRGAGYHELKNGGVLQMHVDFNKHTFLNLHRRINLLIYLNEDWKEEYGGCFKAKIKKYQHLQKIYCLCLIQLLFFLQRLYSYHGNPDTINCPDNKSRKSLAYYYYTTEI